MQLIRSVTLIGPVLLVAFAGCSGQDGVDPGSFDAEPIPGEAIYHSHSRSFETEGANANDNHWSVAPLPNLSLRNEAGQFQDWDALAARMPEEGENGATRYLFVEQGTGCVRGVGVEASTSASAQNGETVTTRSRYNNYFLGEKEYVSRQLDEELYRPLLLVALAIMGRAGTPNDDGTYDGVLDGAVVVNTERAVKISFAGHPLSDLTDRWQIEAEFDNWPAFPLVIRWERFRGDSVVEVGNLTRERQDPGESVILIRNCPARPEWAGPRAPTRFFTSSDVPASEAIPPQYPMTDAYGEALNVSEVQDFRGRHPDMRLMGMYASGWNFVLSNPVGTIREYLWYCRFASPADQVYIEIKMIRKGLDSVPASAASSWVVMEDEVPSKPGFAPDSVTESTPLVPLGEILGLAAAADLADPNRVGWGEPPYWVNHHPYWYVAFQDPNFGQIEGTHRLYYFFNADTGWLSYSSYDVEP